ncbi:aminotransferase class I/II-fold pyridoxal phosphate-dependent enzyme, partial [bacterium]|nr:aminotransferase class I/II-fold pyridoxal phosphate-dependent enzyme [bacterium]
DTFENSILIDSISKRYSSCGARIGVIASKNRDVISSSLKFAQARLSSPTIEQWAARAGLLMDHSYFDPILKEYQARRDTVMHGFSKIPGVICKTPHGAFYVIAKLPIQNAEAFARWLLTDFEHNGETVLLAPAQGFYATPNLGTSEVRISYVLETEKLKKAMTALGAGVKAFQSYEKTQVPVEAKKKVSFGNEENNSKSDSYTSSFRRTME